MNYYKQKLYTFFSILLVSFMALVVPAEGYGQTANSIISDGSVLGQASAYVDFSILELSSTERGFLLSKMTTAEKENIPASELTNGLVIFNTDTECVEYYNGQIKDWLSACGDLGPAEFVWARNSCNAVQVMGPFAKGGLLDPSINLMSIEVTVTKPGTYHIRGTAENTGENPGANNNYVFNAEGVFLQTGTFTVILKATGKPLYAGYARNGTNQIPAGVGDEITMYFNNVEANDCKPRVFIDLGAISFTTLGHEQKGILYQDTEPTYKNPNATLELKLTNIQGAGEVEFYTYEQNGLVFSGTQFISQQGGTNQVVTLTGKGKSVNPLPTTLEVYNNAYFDMSSGQLPQAYNAMVNIAPINLDILCTEPGKPIKVNGKWETGKPIGNANTIEIPVKVLAPGKGRIKGVINNGVSNPITFESRTTEFEFDQANGDIQYVIINPTNTTTTILLTNLEMDFSWESSGGQEYEATAPVEVLGQNDVCSLEIEAATGEAIFTFTGKIDLESKFVYKSGSATGIPYVTPRTDMGASGTDDFRIKVGINVSAIGSLELRTNTVNGVYFEGATSLSTTGVHDVYLRAYGKSEIDLKAIDANYTVSLVSGILSTGSAPSINIDYVYRPMTVYSIGGPTAESWHPGGNQHHDWGAGPLLVRNDHNFGWNGVVRIAKLSFIGVSGTNGLNNIGEFKANSISTFEKNIQSSDFAYVGGSYGKSFAKDDSNLTKLSEYIKSDYPVIYGETDLVLLKKMVDKLYPGNTMTFANDTNAQARSGKPMAIKTTLSELIFGQSSSHFGKEYGFTMANRYIAGSNYGANNTVHSTTFDANYFEALSYLSSNNANEVFSFIAKLHPFVGIGNSGFGGGRIRDNPDNSVDFPTTAKKNGNKYSPISNSIFNIPNGTTKINVDNAMFLLNLMHWGIDRAQELQPNEIK